jgi:hypothetical protein
MGRIIMNEPAMIFLDGEYGGIGLKYSLLSLCLIVTDKQFNTIDELNLFIKPDTGDYIVCGEALEVNKINLVEHDKIAIAYKKAGTMLYNFLSKNSNAGRIKLVPIGHGFDGDLRQIFDKLISRESWENFVSYRRLDTSVAVQFLKSCDLFSESVSGSLSSLVEYFGIALDEKMIHTAKGDTLYIIEVMKHLKEHMSNLQVVNNNTGNIQNEVT